MNSKTVLQQIQHSPERNRRIGLVSDSAADLTQEIIEKYQIAVAPVKMDWPDIEDLPGENTFQKMREAKKRGIEDFGKTSQPSPKDFLDAFQRQLERFEKIICITVTSKLSGTYNSALQARNLLGPEKEARVFVVDSLNASCGTGLLVLKAVDLINQDKNIEEIVKELEKFTPQIYLYGILEDIKWLEASGRISSTLAGWVRKMQKIGIRPIIGVKKGLIKAVGIKIGVKDISSALLSQLKTKTERLKKQGKKIRIAIAHGDNLEEAKKLKEMIENELKEGEVAFINLIDDVLAVLAGPDALLLGWCEV